MKDWIKTTLGEHVDLLTGFPFPSSSYTDSESGIRLLRGDNVAPGSIAWENAKRWPSDGSNAMNKYQTKIGDVVLAMDRTWIKSGVKYSVLEGRDTPSFLVQRVARLRGSRTISGRYIPYIIGSHKFEQYVKGVKTETAVPHISAEQIRDFPILLPPLSEQEKISDILRNWDAAISKCNAVIRTAKQRRQGLMQQLLTGKRRFPGFSKPWGKVEIGSVLNEVDRPIEMKDGDLYRLASVSRNWSGLFEREALHGRDIKTKNLREIKAGDFLISHIQAAYGALALVPQAFDGFKVSNMYSCLRPKDPAKFDLRFFAYLAQQPRMTYLCRTSSNGFFAERLRLNFMPDVFLQQTIDIPPSIEEQRRIINTLELADHELALLEKLLAAYRGQKKGLMQQLLTGKRRVSSAQIGSPSSSAVHHLRTIP